MTKVKALLFTILICTGFIFNGELYLLYMNHFQASYYEADFYTDNLSDTMSDREIKQDFIDAGERHQVDFFVVDQKNQSVLSSEYVIYGTEKALRQVKDSGIKEGRARSFFFGETAVRFEDYRDITDIGKYRTYYFIGGDEKLTDIRTFKADLINQYSGGFPKQMGSERGTQMNLLSAWGIIFALSLLLSLYGILYRKKETMVRLILGENLKTIFLRSITADTIVYCLIFFAGAGFLQYFSYVLFRFSFVAKLFAVFLLINALLTTLILHVDFKKDLSSAGRRGLLAASYGIKAAATVLVTLVLAANIAVIQSSLNLYAQKEFFDIHKEYSYTALRYPEYERGKTAEDTLALNQRFYQRFQDKALVYADLTGNLDLDYPVILTNRKSFSELADEYPAIKEAAASRAGENTCVLMPSNFTTDSPEYHYGREMALIFGDRRSCETVFYTPGISVPGIHGVDTYKMTLYRDPIIVCNYETLAEEEFDKYENGYYYRDIMYQVSPQDWEGFADDDPPANLQLSKSNVLSVYEHGWEIAALELKLVLVLSVFLLLLEMALIIFIIRMEYRLNAVELALKKVYGYSLAARNKAILRTTIYSSMTAMAAAWILGRILNLQLGIPLVIAAAVLLLSEILYVFWRAKKTEEKRIISILKGEKL